MPNVKGIGDLTVLDVNSFNMLGVIESVDYELELDKADTSTALRAGERAQTVKKGGRIIIPYMSALASDSGLVASNLAVGALTIGGTSFLSYLRGGSLSGGFQTREVSGVADVFKWPQHFAKNYAIDLNLMVPLSSTPNIERTLMANLHDTDLLDQDLTRTAFSITIDGSAITIPCEVASIRMGNRFGEERQIALRLTGNDPGTGDYPTSPTGTTTLLEKCFNAYNTAIAVALTSAAGSEGVAYSGNVIPGPFSFSFNDAEIIRIQLELLTRGTFAAVNGS